MGRSADEPISNFKGGAGGGKLLQGAHKEENVWSRFGTSTNEQTYLQCVGESMVKKKKSSRARKLGWVQKVTVLPRKIPTAGTCLKKSGKLPEAMRKRRSRGGKIAKDGRARRHCGERRACANSKSTNNC